LLERGLFTAEEWAEFTYKNAVLLFGGMNPRFFDGTPAESAAARVLAEHPEFRPERS
jgi:hypothetical protein